MRRRSVLASSATALSLLVTGCGGDGGDDGTPTPEFSASISFPDCTTATVDAEEYSAVALSLENGTTEMHEEGYTGEETFEGSGVINEVVVWGPGGTENAFQEDLESCGTDGE